MMYIAGVKKPVDTGDTYFEEISKLEVSGSVVARHNLQRDKLKTLEIYGTNPLEARVEYARWIVDCPNCNGAEFAFEDNLFLCSLCKNSDIEGKARKVKMPRERKQIEMILAKRPIKNRHWNPNQTVKDLERENTSHKLEVI